MLAVLLARRVVEHREGLQHLHRGADDGGHAGLDEQVRQMGLSEVEVRDPVQPGLRAGHGLAGVRIVQLGANQLGAGLVDDPVADFGRRQPADRQDTRRRREDARFRRPGPGGDIDAPAQIAPTGAG